MDSDKEVTAQFVYHYALTVDVSPGGSGIVTLEPSQPAEGYVAGTGVSLTAVASDGYRFDHWSGALSGSKNPATITMDSDKGVTAYFVRIYTLRVDVSPGGGGRVSLQPAQPAGGYVAGTGVTLTAIASKGYEFAHWGGDLSGSTNPTSVVMDGNKIITADFTQITYTLTVDVGPGGNGSIELDGTALSSYPASSTFVYGASVNLEAIPVSGYEFAHWGGDLSGSTNPISIVMDGNKIITANFAQITYTLTVDVNPGSGAVTLEPAQPAGGYVAGAEVSLTAVASEGHEFDHWSGDLSGTENPATIAMDSDKEVVAYFTQITYILTVDVGPGGTGSIELDGTALSSYPASSTFVYGASVNLEAIPTSGYEFAQWGGDLSGSTNPISIVMDGNKIITANFAQITYALTVDVSPGGAGSIEVDGTAFSSYPAPSTFVYGTSVNLEAIPASGHEFAHWGGDLSGSTNPTSVVMDGNKTITADFTQITYTLTVDVGPGGTGSIELDGTALSSYPASSTFVYGASVNLEAIPASGYEFAQWDGDLSGTENPTTIAMDSGKEVTAHFVRIYTLTVDVDPGGSTVTMEPSQPPGGYVVGTEVGLTAVASEGYKFDHWSGDLSGTENPTTIVMDSDKGVTTHFVRIHTLTVNGNGVGGTVTLEPSQPPGGYVVGTEVSLTTVASEGYKFDCWSGDLSGTGNPVTIIMDSDKEVTASFTKVVRSPFPWWWIVVGVVVIGLLAYFLVMRRRRGYGKSLKYL